MTNKEKYDNIEVPTQLDDITKEAIARASQVKKRRHFPVGAVSAVAACLAFFVLCNVPSVAASMEKVPVLGTIVQILRVGGGGVTTDGVESSVSAVNGSVRIDFTQDGVRENNAPHFEVVKESTPHRLIITLNGVREFSFANTAEEFKKLPFVRDVYKITYLDDSGFCFAVELNQDADYLVSEYKDPGYIELTLTAKEKPQGKNVYIVRTAEMEMGEGIAALCETLGVEPSSITKTQSGKYCIASKPYDSEAQAKAELANWKALCSDDTAPFVESLKNDQNPK